MLAPEDIMRNNDIIVTVKEIVPKVKSRALCMVE